MIRFSEEDAYNGNSIQFDRADFPKVIKLFERALNTLSPPDPELNQVLDDLKESK